MRCAVELSTRDRRRMALGVLTLMVSVGVATVTWIRLASEYAAPFSVVFALFGVAVGLYLVWSRPAPYAADSVRRRLPGEGPAASEQAASEQAASESDKRPRKMRARRVVAALGPTLSARLTAYTAMVAMALTASAFPKLLHLPRWLEFEFVLAVWWLLGAVGLMVVLYRGLHVDDDHLFYAPGPLTNAGPDLKWRSCADGCDPSSGCSDADGCDAGVALIALALAALAAVAVSLLVAWVVVEVVLPIAFLAFYATTTAALKRAAHDRHDCRGRMLKSIGWGVVWATAYVAPLALTLGVLHALR